MTKEELEKDYYADRPTEPYSDDNSPNDWANIAHYAEENLEKTFERIAELEKENTELKERHVEIIEAFASASSGDDFEMAESAREIMEILNIPCYRHGKVVSKLTKAKELLEDLIRFQPYIDKAAMFLSIGNEWKTAIYKAKQFLKETK